jgi:hypothetical protein
VSQQHVDFPQQYFFAFSRKPESIDADEDNELFDPGGHTVDEIIEACEQTVLPAFFFNALCYPGFKILNVDKAQMYVGSFYRSQVVAFVHTGQAYGSTPSPGFVHINSGMVKPSEVIDNSDHVLKREVGFQIKALKALNCE